MVYKLTVTVTGTTNFNPHIFDIALLILTKLATKNYPLQLNPLHRKLYFNLVTRVVWTNTQFAWYGKQNKSMPQEWSNI